MRSLHQGLLLFLLIILPAHHLLAQDTLNLFQQLDNQDKADTKTQTTYATSIFKTTRIINGQSIENLGKGILDVKISHRFGPLNSGAYNFFGLDNADERIGLNYGITNWLMIGIARSSYQKEYDGFAKLKLLRQSTGKVNMPVSVSIVSSIMDETLKFSDTIKHYYTDRLYFSTQLLIARKFGDYFSFQVAPTLVHYNLAANHTIPNDLYSIGFGGRLRISHRVNLTAEYYYQLPNYKLPGTYNSLSVGVDIETGGHVFQFQLTNSTGMTDRTFITQTMDQWSKGGIHFGFNISRVFTIVKPKVYKKTW